MNHLLHARCRAHSELLQPKIIDAAEMEDDVKVKVGRYVTGLQQSYLESCLLL